MKFPLQPREGWTINKHVLGIAVAVAFAALEIGLFVVLSNPKIGGLVPSMNTQTGCKPGS